MSVVIGIKAVCGACERQQSGREPYVDVGEFHLCKSCSPTYADMRTQTFFDQDGEPLRPREIEEIIAAHLADGGDLTDKLGFGPEQS
ncbi:hypothetical protein ACQU0X_31755 [Pseudovibrio ascidiaceicola]|uniref:hypothetical protein n=1 Tax=Pseudovibrio ascidiaceicola TaxID=285279 RepID=UPI003D35E27D